MEHYVEHFRAAAKLTVCRMVVAHKLFVQRHHPSTLQWGEGQLELLWRYGGGQHRDHLIYIAHISTSSGAQYVRRSSIQHIGIHTFELSSG
jgi:hypothetical protein